VPFRVADHLIFLRENLDERKIDICKVVLK
jgi:hypothetical protein